MPVSENRDEESVVIKGVIPSALKLQFKVLCVQRDLRMSTVLENLIKQWLAADAPTLELMANGLDEDSEEIKGYIPKSLKHQFKVLCVQKRAGMGPVLHSLIQEWVQAGGTAN